VAGDRSDLEHRSPLPRASRLLFWNSQDFLELALNGHVGPAEVQAVISEHLLESSALIDSIVNKAETTTDLTNRQRDARLKKLDEAIAKATAGLREAHKKEALAAIEEQFAGEAA
jgi:hypothetical protein